MYFILFIAIAVASYAVQASLKSKFSTYSKTPLSNGMTGAQVAEKMLRDNGINNVKVTQIEGQLTDHYNPATLTVNLSRNVYYGSSVAAAAVAAHECGHAVQHATKYSFLQLRSNLVPAVSFASNVMPWILLAGIVLLNIFPGLLLFGIGLYALTTLFSFVTLPVEINASQRAMAWLSYKIPCSGVISRPAASTSCRSFFITSAGIHLRSTLTVRTRLRLRTMSIGA